MEAITGNIQEINHMQRLLNMEREQDEDEDPTLLEGIKYPGKHGKLTMGQDRCYISNSMIC